MAHHKWLVTAGIVVLMFVGATVTTLFERRSVHAEQKRVRAAVARAYGHQPVRVVSCDVRNAPASEQNKLHPQARYLCSLVVSGCPQKRPFKVPVLAGGTPADAVATPSGPPDPRSCL